MRTSRIIAPGLPHHVLQFGNYAHQVFKEAGDYEIYLGWLAEYGKRFSVEIWAYCLMPNHVHYVCVPHTETGLARIFNTLHMRYAQYFNPTPSPGAPLAGPVLFIHSRRRSRIRGRTLRRNKSRPLAPRRRRPGLSLVERPEPYREHGQSRPPGRLPYQGARQRLGRLPSRPARPGCDRIVAEEHEDGQAVRLAGVRKTA